MIVRKSHKAATCVLVSGMITDFVGPVHGQCARYEVDVIPGLDCQFIFSQSSATGISETGEICGGYNDCGKGGSGAVWLGKWWISLPLPSAVAWVGPQDINSSRQMATIIPDPFDPEVIGTAAFYDFESSTLIDLGELPGDNRSVAHAINESGAVCGLSVNNIVGLERAFVWQTGQMSALNLPMGPNSEAYGIADTGAVCGWMGIEPHTSAHPFIWLDGKTTDLGVVEKSLGAEARSISSNGLAVTGRVVFPDPDPQIVYQKRAFIWHDGRAENLGVLAFSHNESIGYAVNDSKIVVGLSTNQFGVGPTFVWRNGVMTALNDLIPAGLNIDISSVPSINNAGQIAVNARVLDDKGFPTGDQVAVRLTPNFPTGGDTDCNGRVDMDDLLGVINQWGPAIPTTSADFNNDGTVGIDDLMEVLRGWGR